MEEVLITESELDYLTNIPQTVAEEPASYMTSEPEMSFEEAVKECNGITLDEFAEMWDESINRLIPE